MTYCSLEEAWGINYKINKIEDNDENISNNLNIPAYGTNLKLNNSLKSNSKNVPYQIKLPENSIRNNTGEITIEEENDLELNSMLDTLTDNDEDIEHIDIERNIKNDYYNTEDYKLYKKYLNLAEKYKSKLKSKYRNFKEDKNQEIFENFNFNDTKNLNLNDNNIKDIIIIIIVGIFIIFALDIFVRIGVKSRD